MENASLPRSPIAKVRKKGWGKPRQPRAGEQPGLATFTDSALRLRGADYRERLNSLSLTHIPFLWMASAEKELARICLGRRNIIPIKRILVVIPFELYICRYKYFIRG